MTDLSTILLRFIEPLSVAVAVLGVVVSLLAAIRAGALKRVAFGPLSIEGAPEEVAKAKELIASLRERRGDAIPFETEQLANYYAQVLAQSKVSFWFSLVFASLGFLVIIAAALLYSQERTGSTIASFSAGAIIDAVAALFFVQSKNAQRAMGEFFDKLRKDRMQAEARAMCESIQDAHTKDALRVQLALYYSGIDDHKAISAAVLEAKQSVVQSAGA